MSVWTRIQGTGNNSGGKTASISATFPSSVTPGNYILIGWAGLNVDGHNFDTITITDNKSGNTYTLAVNNIFSTGAYQYLYGWYCPVVTGGSSFTITITPTNSAFQNIDIGEYHLNGTFVSSESSAFNNGTSISPSSGNLTVSATDLLYGIATQSDNVLGNPFTAGSGFTARHSDTFVGGVSVGFMAEDQFDVTTNNTPVTFGLSSSVVWQAAGFSLKATPILDYPTTILAESSLISYWKLDETSGTVATDSKDSNTGTYTGGFTLNQSTSYPLTPSTLLNGSTGYISVADATNLHLTNVTMEAWIKTTNSGAQDIVGKYTSAGNLGWAIRVNSGKINVWSGSGTWDSGFITVNDGNWHYIVATISSTGGISIYVDAVLDFQYIRTQSLSNTNILTIGRDPTSSGSFFNGNLMHVAIYNTVLSLSSIQTHFEAVGDSGAIRVTQNPVRTLVAPTDQKIRVTQNPVRSLIAPTDNIIRNTQNPVRTLVAPTDNTIRITQSAIRVLSLSPLPSRVSQEGLLTVIQGSPTGRITQEGLLSVTQGSPTGRISQMGLLVIVPNVKPTAYLGLTGGFERAQQSGGFLN